MVLLASLLGAFPVSPAAEAAPPLPDEATGAAVVYPSSFYRTYYVGHGGNDASSNVGMSYSNPLATIQEAVDRAFVDQQEGRHVRVLIKNGVYNQQAVEENPVNTASTLVIEAENEGMVTLNGADKKPISQWTPSGPNYILPWSMDWGGSDATERKEMVYVNGDNLRQVMTYGELAAGTFYVDVANDRITMRPPAGVSLSSQTDIEVTSRQWGLRFTHKKNLIIKGIRVQRVYGFGGFSLVNCSNVLLDRVIAVDNSDHGIHVRQSNKVTYNHVVSDHNGSNGFASDRMRDFLIKDSQTNANSWRADWAEWGGYAHGGLKFLHTHQVTIKRHTSNSNLSTGIWFDTDVSHIRIEDSEIDGNRGRGIFLEAGQGPFLVRRNIIANTQKVPDDYRFMFLGGISLEAVKDVTLEKNILYNNYTRDQYGIHAQIWVHDLFRRTDWDSMYNFELCTSQQSIDNVPIPGCRIATRTINHSYKDNVLLAGSSSQIMMALPPMASEWTNYYSSLESGHNNYWNGSKAYTFWLVEGLGAADGSSAPTVLSEKNLNEWRTYNGEDTWQTGSAYQAPSFVHPSGGIFDRNTNSPVNGWGLPGADG